MTIYTWCPSCGQFFTLADYIGHLQLKAWQRERAVP